MNINFDLPPVNIWSLPEDISAWIKQLQEMPSTDRVALEISIAERWLDFRERNKRTFPEEFDQDGSPKKLGVTTIDPPVNSFSAVSEIEAWIYELQTMGQADDEIVIELDYAQRWLLDAREN